MSRSIQARFVLVLILLILLAMQVISVYLLQSLERYYIRDLSQSLNPTARVISGLVHAHLETDDYDQRHLDDIVEYFAAQPGLDVAIIDNRSVIRSASGEWTLRRGERYNQLDVSVALTGSPSEGIRPEPETGVRLYNVAVPVRSDDRVVGAVHVLGSLDKVYSTMADVRMILLSATGLAMLIAIVIGYLLARTITGPIRELTGQAAAIAAGDFDRKITVRSRDEIGRLGETFNYMGQQLKETLSEISREKSRAEAILSHMADGIVAVNRDGVVTMINPAAASMLNLESGRVEGRSLTDLNLPALNELGPGTEDSPDLGVNTISAPGDRTLRVYTAPVSREGKTAGYVLVVHDVTEQENLERLRREFVANVSHELRTPLTTIKSYLETLIEGELSDPDVAPRFLRIALDETDRMVRMVRDLLRLSHLDQGQVPWKFTAMGPEELVSDVASKMVLQFKPRGQSLTVDFGNVPLPAVRGDRDRLEQVLMNLLANALEFTPAETGSVSIMVRTDNSRVVFTVCDTGIGIPEDELPRVFERFYRVDKARSREFGGTGLGLAIAREIVVAHGGDMTIASVVGEGTRVSFSLPVHGEASGQ